MSRSNKDKIAVTLLSALAFGANDASAMNSGIKNSGNLATKSSQTVGTVGGATSNKNLEKIKKGLSILEKVLIGAEIAVVAGVVADETVAGVMWAKGEESDSILKGEYSFMNLLRSKIKKDDEQPGDKGKNPKELKGKKEENIENKKINKNLESDEKIEGKKSEKIDESLAIFWKNFEDASSDIFNKNKEELKRAYGKVRDSDRCEGFYGNNNISEKEKNIAKAVLNFIANKKKFDTDFEVSNLCLHHEGVLVKINVQVNGVDNSCFFVFSNMDNGALRVMYSGKFILKF
ncbi:MAG: hypothetical protein J6P21_04460 [Clostridia bacterium]|nr:hypothetical protein [Clostridia bacterium]